MLRGIRFDAKGNCHFEIGGKASRRETVPFDGREWRIAWPERPEPRDRKAAIVLAQFDDAPAGDVSVRRYRDFFFEHGPRVRFRDEHGVQLGTLSGVRVTGRTVTADKGAIPSGGAKRAEASLEKILDAALATSKERRGAQAGGAVRVRAGGAADAGAHRGARRAGPRL